MNVSHPSPEFSQSKDNYFYEWINWGIEASRSLQWNRLIEERLERAHPVWTSSVRLWTQPRYAPTGAGSNKVKRHIQIIEDRLEIRKCALSFVSFVITEKGRKDIMVDEMSGSHITNCLPLFMWNLCKLLYKNRENGAYQSLRREWGVIGQEAGHCFSWIGEYVLVCRAQQSDYVNNLALNISTQQGILGALTVEKW